MLNTRMFKSGILMSVLALGLFLSLAPGVAWG